MTSEYTPGDYPVYISPLKKPRQGYLGIILPANPEHYFMVVLRQTTTFGLQSMKIPKYLHDTILAWWRIDVPIQSTALNTALNPEQREFLISGMAPKQQARIFNNRLDEEVKKNRGMEDREND